MSVLSVSHTMEDTCVSLCPHSGHTFQWKIQIYLDLRKSDKKKKVNRGKEKSGHVRRQCWPMVEPSGWDAVHENLSSSCQETSQGLSTCSSLIEHSLPLLLMSDTFLLCPKQPLPYSVTFSHCIFFHGAYLKWSYSYICLLVYCLLPPRRM